MPTAIVSMTSPRGSTPSIRSDLMTIPSETSERPSVIITDDINRLLQYLHGLENDRQRDNQGVHDHLGEIQNELRDLADYIHEKEAPTPAPPVELKDQSVGGGSVVSWGSPRGAPDYPPIPHTVTGKALVPISLTPPLTSPRTPSTLSSSISFLESYHSDDLSLVESEPFIQQPPSPLMSSISSSPPSSSLSSSPSSSPSSRTLPLTPISQSPLSSGEYLSQTSTEVTRRALPRTVSPTPSVVSSATVRPGIDRDALNRIREVLDAVKAQTDALQDGQQATNNILDDLRERCPLLPDNTELVERLQRLEDLINRLADAQRRARAPTPEQESLFDSGSDTSTAIRRLRERWDRMRLGTPSLIAPMPQRPPTSLDDLMAELLHPPQPSAPLQIQPPPAFVPLNFRPDARGPRPRSTSPTLLTEIPPRPYTVPRVVEPFVARDLGRRRPSRTGRPPRQSAIAPSQFGPLQPPETPVTRHDIGRRQPDDTGPDFLDGVHQLRGRRRPDGWVQEPVAVNTILIFHSVAHAYAPCSLPHQPMNNKISGVPPRHRQWRRVLGRYVILADCRALWLSTLQPPPPGPGPMPQFAQPGVVPPIPPPFTQVQISLIPE